MRMNTGKYTTNALATATDETDFASVLGIITTHRSRALMSVNVESLLTYWEIGAFLSPRIHSGSWSTAVVGKLADYIRRNQPELRGYGKSNLYNMARVYDVFSTTAFTSLVTKYEARIPELVNFFQPVDGKRSVGDGALDFFQTAAGKSFPRILTLTTFSTTIP